MRGTGVDDSGAFLVAIDVFPVKSLPGLRLDAVTVGPEGLAGDRALVLAGEDGSPLTVKAVPRLRELGLSGPVDAPLVSAPGERPGDLRAVAAFLGVGHVRLLAAPGGARQVAAVHVATEAERAGAGAGDASRANLVLRPSAGSADPFGPVPAWAGSVGWAGSAGWALRVGSVLLRLEGQPRHCAGSFAAVLRGGALRTGDAARVRPAGPGEAPG